MQNGHFSLIGPVRVPHLFTFVPGQELVVSRGSSGRKGGEDLYASIDAVFEAAQRVVAEHTRARRAS